MNSTGALGVSVPKDRVVFEPVEQSDDVGGCGDASSVPRNQAKARAVHVRIDRQ